MKTGILSFYKGATATVIRAAIVTATQLAVYDHTKHMLINHNIMKNDFNCYVACSIVTV